jgi:hypothetical protein
VGSGDRRRTVIWSVLRAGVSGSPAKLVISRRAGAGHGTADELWLTDHILVST